MSALSNAKADGMISDAILEAVKPYFTKAIWDWFDQNRDRVLFSKRILVFSFKITVGDFEGIIAEIAGPRPVAAAP